MKKRIAGIYLIFCGLTGCLVGAGIAEVAEQIKLNMSAKDDTLPEETTDSVFFGIGETKEAPEEILLSELSDGKQDTEPEITVLQNTDMNALSKENEETEEKGEVANVPEKVVIRESFEEEKLSELLHTTDVENGILSKSYSETDSQAEHTSSASEAEQNQWKLSEVLRNYPAFEAKMTADADSELQRETADHPATEIHQEVADHPATEIQQEVADSPVTETIRQPEDKPVLTYPAEIFGQIPVENRSDEFVSYFEFALDMVTILQPEIQAKGLSETALFAKFVVKALICGIDISNLDINAPISRKEAALALWIAADVLEKPGCNSKVQSAGAYAADVGSCSPFEKKAVVYLYEQEVCSGADTKNFFPKEPLSTEDGTRWITQIKQCWK